MDAFLYLNLYPWVSNMNRKNESIASFFLSNSVSSLDAVLGEMLEIMKGILGKEEIGGREMVCV